MFNDKCKKLYALEILEIKRIMNKGSILISKEKLYLSNSQLLQPLSKPRYIPSFRLP